MSAGFSERFKLLKEASPSTLYDSADVLATQQASNRLSSLASLCSFSTSIMLRCSCVLTLAQHDHGSK